MRSCFLAAIILASVSLWGQIPANTKVDPNLLPYRPAPGVTGTVTIVGSDAMESLVNLWYSGLRKLHPDVALKSTTEGSTAAFLALLEGESLVGSMSREMSKSEITAFQAKYGYAPTRLVVGLEALGIVVHNSNPIQSLTLEQLDAMFSTTRKQGAKEALTSWGTLGLNGDWINRRVTLYGRDENAGARVFFRDKVLLKGELRPNVITLEDAASLIERVSLDAGGIGYASISDLNSLARTVPIVSPSGFKVLPTLESITKGDYPLTHFLYLYVNKAPGKPLPLPVYSFLSFALSKEGQTAVALTNIPIPADVARNMLLKLQ